MSRRSNRVLLVFYAVTTFLFSALTVWAQTSTVRITSGLSRPLFVTSPQGDTNRLFLVEQGGTIKTLDLLNTSSVNPYLSIGGLTTGGERGLLGMAFDPNFANNGFFYVYVSVLGGPMSHRSEIRRYSAMGDPMTSGSADPNSDELILSFNQPFGNHNGGWIGFNPQIHPTDKQYLYIATGDGGSGGDPQNNAQNVNNLLGNILRIDPSRDPNNGGYLVPNSNPFVGASGRDEIWSYGLRNPFRASFDRETGDMWIGDVGQEDIEEIDFEPVSSSGGVNFGWRVMEGNSCFDNSQTGGNPPCNDPILTPPVYDYSHGGDPDFRGNSVTGGNVYRGSVDALQGHYIFADFGSNRIWKIDPDAVNIEQSVRRIDNQLLPNMGSISSITSFGEDDAGELYLTDHGGEVFKIVTSSKDMEWNGNDAGAGNPGNGSSWNDADNWTRDSILDQAFMAEDNLIFQPGSSVQTINLQGNRTVAAVTFAADYTLTNNTLIVRSGNIAVNNGVTATVNSGLSAESSDHSLRKLGDGTLLVNGTAGQMVVKGGTLGGQGTISHITVRDGGTVAPGNSTAILTVSNSYIQELGGTLTVEIAGMTPGNDHDQLNVLGTATLGGTLQIDTQVPPLPGGGPGVIGDTFTIMRFAAHTGEFDDVVGRHVEGGVFYDVDINPQDVTLGAFQALEGDSNGDRNVDLTDFQSFLVGFTGGGMHNWTEGDFNNDAKVDITDFSNAFLPNFGTTGYGVTSLPEPYSAGLVVWSAVFLVMMSRRLFLKH